MIMFNCKLSADRFIRKTTFDILQQVVFLIDAPLDVER